MRIDNRPIDLQRPGQSSSVEGSKPETSSRQAVTQVTSTSRADQVQISDAGRALAAQQAEGTERSREGLSAERVAQIRQRIYEGAYNSVEVVDQVARRMLERGDV